MKTYLRSATMANLPAVLRRHGVDILPLLRKVSIPVASLHDPERPVPVEQAYRLLELAAVTANCPSLGLEVGEANRLSVLGLLGLVLREEPTFGDALNTLLRYRQLHNESLVLALEWFSEGSRDFCLLKMTLRANQGVPVAQATEQGLAMLLRSLRALIGLQWRPRVVCIRHLPLGPRMVYQRVLDAPLQFQAEFDGLMFDRGDLDLPVRSADPVIALQARQQLDQLLSARGANSASQRVSELVRVLLPAGRCSIEQVAMHLGLHRRTLHRHLQAEGTTFEAITEQIRTDMAVALLTADRRPLGQVADLLGFSSPPAFSRWFKRVHGQSAREYRRNSYGNPAHSSGDPGAVLSR